MLDFRHETFLALCKIKNYTKTAQHLNMTQPAVTQHIQHLENIYGGKLFCFKDRRLNLTERGKKLYDFTIAVKADISRIKDILASQDIDKAPVTFGATLTIGEYIMPVILKKLIQHHPGLTFTMLVDNTQTLLQKLRDGIIQFAVVEGYFDKAQYASKLISEEEFIAICSKKSELANKNASLDELLRQCLILRENGSGTREVFEQVLRQHNLTCQSFSKIYEVGNLNAIKLLVEDDCGISFMYKAAARKELISGKLCAINTPYFNAKHEFNFVYLKNSIHETEYLNWFDHFHSVYNNQKETKKSV